MERKQEEEILEVTLRQQRNDPQSTLPYLFGLVAIMAIVETLITRCSAKGDHGDQVYITITITINAIAIIIITRPKPAYGRQGLAGSWGQDTNQARIFWGILNVSLRTSGAQLGYEPTWNHEKK